ncbi:hypothetical protein CLV56_1145 [Mumia flava]|uniref:SalK n=1 Tax=Mumia flava TaxID=1348852 RepID=A0A0B2BRP6_9ACTN|nr:hypothetical protein [Mumia flava]PJJ56928.1 hypothetical protein CLV56_1145 [Mumia flava]
MSISDATRTDARTFWHAYEPVHAVCYFHPRFASAMHEAGLTGSWNGYFAGRAAPLGPTPPEVVTALFHSFAPAMVAKAVPKVWDRITPGEAVQARLAAADAVLAEHAAAGSLDDLRRVTDRLERAIDSLAFDGRALAAAWRSVPRPESVLSRLWLATAVLREHRGDGHVVAATGHGLTGLEAGLTHVGTGQVSRALLQRARGWSDAEWETAQDALVDRGILTRDGTLTPDGATLRHQVEEATDRLASTSLRTLDEPDWCVRTLTGLARALFDGGAIGVPNPIGLTRP